MKFETVRQFNNINQKTTIYNNSFHAWKIQTTV